MIIADKKNITELQQEMTRIHRQSSSIYTNYYNQCNQSIELFPCWIGEATCVFMWNDIGVHRIFFYSSNGEELVEILKMMETGSSIDYITKDRNENAKLFEKAGYNLRLEQGRFHMGQLTKEQVEMHNILKGTAEIEKQLYHAEDYGEPAQVEDAEEIDRCLREKFDPYEAHFYSMEKLKDCIQRGWVWVAKKDGKIIAAKLFEIQGKKSYGSYSFNNGPVEVITSMGAKAFAAIKKMGAVYDYCWMNLGNKRAIRYATKFDGYVFDGIYNVVYVKGGERGNTN